MAAWLAEPSAAAAPISGTLMTAAQRPATRALRARTGNALIGSAPSARSLPCLFCEVTTLPGSAAEQSHGDVDAISARPAGQPLVRAEGQPRVRTEARVPPGGWRIGLGWRRPRRHPSGGIPFQVPAQDVARGIHGVHQGVGGSEEGAGRSVRPEYDRRLKLAQRR